MDHIRVGKPLQREQLPSYNQMAVKTIAMETWNAAISDDGPNGSRNIVGKLIFNCQTVDARPTRSKTAGEIKISTCGLNTFVSHGSAVWNACVDLRKAATKSEALRAATAFARNAPV
jgi:hypothetical protein